MLRKNVLKLSCGLIFTAGVFFSCSSDDDSSTPSKEEIVQGMLTELRTVTAQLKTEAAAEAAGWDEALSECVAHPTEGAMGYHIARIEYMDGRVNHKQPQVLLFAPKTQGEGLELVGVEFIVPFSKLPATSEAPELFFEKFHKNTEQQIWALHVWTERNNPKGIFYDWNPNVSCE